MFVVNLLVVDEISVAFSVFLGPYLSIFPGAADDKQEHVSVPAFGKICDSGG